MNDRMRPTGPPVQQKVNINLNDAPTAGCPVCGCIIFAVNVALYKKVSAIQVGKPMLALVPLSLCQDCGAVVQPVGDELKLVEAVPKDGEGDDAD